MSNVICDCPHPPGGRVECESHQMAYCIIENGVTRSGCVDPPNVSRGYTRQEQSAFLVDWAIKQLVASADDGSAQIKPEYMTFDTSVLQILKNGSFDTNDFSLLESHLTGYSQGSVYEGQTNGTFHLPKMIQDAVAQIERPGGASSSESPFAELVM